MQPSRLALIAVLARAGDAGVTRDRLRALLWPELDTSHAGGALRQALYAIRRVLGDVIEGGWQLRLDGARLSSDAARFEAALARHAPEAAVRWYRGPFLDGFYNGSDAFERWAARERDQLGQRYVAAIEELAVHAASAHAAVAWWRRLVAVEPSSPRAVMRLMEALVRDGDRYAALECARAHADLLREEYDMSPDPAVELLAHRLERRGDSSRPDSISGELRQGPGA